VHRLIQGGRRRGEKEASRAMGGKKVESVQNGLSGLKKKRGPRGGNREDRKSSTALKKVPPSLDKKTGKVITCKWGPIKKKREGTKSQGGKGPKESFLQRKQGRQELFEFLVLDGGPKSNVKQMGRIKKWILEQKKKKGRGEYIEKKTKKQQGRCRGSQKRSIQTEVRAFATIGS